MVIMDTRDNIIGTARELFCQYGIKSITMDDICKQLGISKKTLYNYFGQKDDLIEAVLLRSKQSVGEAFGKLMADNPSIWDLLDKLPATLQKMPDVRKVPPFYYDLNKYYPVLAKKHSEVVYAQNVEMTTRFLERGVEEGMFRSDLDVEVTAHFLSRIYADAMADITSPPQYGIPVKRILDTITDFILRAVLSEKGMAHYEEIKQQ